ncbi:PAS domain S-box protein [Leptothoe kymatousa]|uniref:histidine kinase n=1 Tax=Leptothoe kymatousa TAU-MAC 1615 TaxID=2364775 RepID=A0ABS5Y620_9CYAN|nr:PAS domain S-box protein [Leptothoe kymatousa]MBT9312958.1 PAS domain S-box protein [Leptothoe kymatousa TAU-MAC 1615]
METLQNIFSPTQFIPHGHCYLWQPELIWLHLLSDVLIAIAYYSIPVMLVYFVRKREDIPFPGIFLLFGLFITTCGSTHLMAVWTLWHPAYWLSGVLKAITAIVSIYTALELFPTIPAALALPSPQQLRKINQQLETEIDERKQVEAALQEQLKSRQVIADISTRFIDLDAGSIDTEINQALATIGQLKNIDTSYILDFDYVNEVTCMTHEWTDHNVVPLIGNVQNIPFKNLHWVMNPLQRGEPIVVSSVEQLPIEAAGMKTIWQRYSRQSLVGIPLGSEPHPLGVVVFASCSQEISWTEGDIQLFKIFAEILLRSMQRKQAELALRRSEERWQLAISGTNAGIWDWQIDTDEVFYSPRFKQMLGYEGHEFLDHPDEWVNRVHPDDLAYVQSAVQDHWDHKTPDYKTEHRLRCKDGSYRWVLDQAQVLWDEAGTPVRMVGSHTDITDQKLAEAALQKQLQLGKIVSELSSRFINLDPDDTDSEINHALQVIGQLEAVDTTYIFRYAPTDTTLSMTHEWVAAGHTAQINHAQNLPQAAFPWAFRCLFSGESLIIADVADAPPEATVDTQSWQQFGLQAILTIPLMAKGELWGAVGFASFSTVSPWTDANVQLLTIFAEILFRAQQRQQSALALRRSEERWQLALNGSSAGIWDWDMQTRDIFYSPRCKTMLGYGEHEISNSFDAWENRMHPDDIVRVYATLQDHLDGNTPVYQAEYRMQCKDGSHRWFLDSAKALRNEAGNVIRVTGAYTDITERKRAEEELKHLNQELEARVQARTAAFQESEQRFRSLFESAPDFIYVLDHHGLIQQVNPTVAEQSGYAESELLSQPLSNFLSSNTQATCQQEFADLLITGNHRQEMEFVCKDGRILTMDCSCTLVKDSPSDDYILVLQRDVTQRKQAEEERQKLLVTVQRSEQRWRSFLDNVRLMVVGLDAAGAINYVNPHFLSLMGYRRHEVQGENGLHLLFPQSERQQPQEIFQSLLANKTSSHHQVRVFTCCDKEEKIIEWNTTVLTDADGHSTGILSIGEDVSERYAIDRMKDEFISVVSHELRTPLTSIHGALDLVASGLVTPQSDRGQHVLTIAAENSSRLVQLVDDILELERLESGKVKLRQGAVSIQALTRRAYELIELMAERANIHIELAAELDLMIWADGDRISQVLTNLLSNAIKFSEPSSTVSVIVQEIPIHDGSQIQFMVQDQGRGIPPNKLDHIFERFHQVDASDSRSKGGTGLGLAICSSIVQQHGGKIWAESTLGVGSTFFFTLPAACQVAV